MALAAIAVPAGLVLTREGPPSRLLPRSAFAGGVAANADAGYELDLPAGWYLDPAPPLPPFEHVESFRQLFVAASWPHHPDATCDDESELPTDVPNEGAFVVVGESLTVSGVEFPPRRPEHLASLVEAGLTAPQRMRECPGTWYQDFGVRDHDRFIYGFILWGDEGDEARADAFELLDSLRLQPGLGPTCPPDEWWHPLCPEQRWVRLVAERAGYRTGSLGDQAFRLIDDAAGVRFWLSAVPAGDAHPAGDGYRAIGTVDGTRVFASGAAVVWRVNGLDVRVTPDGELPGMEILRPVVRASAEVAYPPPIFDDA